MTYSIVVLTTERDHVINGDHDRTSNLVPICQGGSTPSNYQATLSADQSTAAAGELQEHYEREGFRMKQNFAPSPDNNYTISQSDYEVIIDGKFSSSFSTEGFVPIEVSRTLHCSLLSIATVKYTCIYMYLTVHDYTCIVIYIYMYM